MWIMIDGEIKSKCCHAEIVDEYDVWVCDNCDKTIMYNTFRGDGSFKSQVEERCGRIENE